MNNTVSMEGIGQVSVTFYYDDEPTPGYPCMMADNYRINNAADGTAFIGVTRRLYDGYATVQTGGYMELPYSGAAPALGWATLAAADSGKVKAASTGTRCLIVQVDSDQGKLGLFL